MDEKEKKEFYIAMCRCCLIAEAMKSCPSCHFNIGLAEKINLVATTPSLIFTQVVMPEQMVAQ